MFWNILQVISTVIIALLGLEKTGALDFKPVTPVPVVVPAGALLNANNASLSFIARRFVIKSSAKQP